MAEAAKALTGKRTGSADAQPVAGNRLELLTRCRVRGHDLRVYVSSAGNRNSGPDEKTHRLPRHAAFDRIPTALAGRTGNQTG